MKYACENQSRFTFNTHGFFHSEAHTILFKGSYLSAHVLLNLLNELTIKSEAPLNILLLYRNEFNKLNDSGAQMLDFMYHMTTIQ